MLKHGILLSSVFFLCAALFAAEEGKSAALNRMREAKAGTLMRGHWLAKQDWKKCLELLEPDGSFKDMKEFEREIRAKELTRKEFSYTEPQSRIVAMTSKAFQRLWAISEALRKDEIPADRGTEVKRALYRAIERYGDIEVNRISTHSGRWHASCFFIPIAAVNLYFSKLQRYEGGGERDMQRLRYAQGECDVEKTGVSGMEPADAERCDGSKYHFAGAFPQQHVLCRRQCSGIPSASGKRTGHEFA